MTSLCSVRTELVEVPAFFGRAKKGQGFDRLSPTGFQSSEFDR